MTLAYDRVGRIATVKDAAGERTFTYDNAGRMLSEEIDDTTNSANLLWGVEVTNTYDGTTKLRTSHTVERSTLSRTVNFGYDDWRRLDHVQKGTLHARFGYHAVTGQVVKTTYIHNDDDPDPQLSPVVVGDREFDRLGRLKSINWTTNTLSATGVASAAYEHDAFGRRVKMSTTPAPQDELLYWEYGHDELNQLVDAQHYWTDGEESITIPGEKFGFGYDDIGNRLFTQEGGDDEGQDTYLSDYTSNLLNQYTVRDVSGNVEVVGRTSSSSVGDVVVNGNTAWLEHGMFHKRLTFTNTSAPVVGQVSVLEVPGLSSTTDIFLPKDPESFTYDADGNLTLDGVWSYEWDAENRLKAMQMRDEVAQVLLSGSDPWARIEFRYDWMGRRISKNYYTTNNDPAVYGTKTGPPITWSIDRCVRYVWDGWHLSLSYRVDEYGEYLKSDQSFAWGPDLSSSYGGAGGIGGLVAYTDDEYDTDTPSSYPNPLGPMYPIYDGNGNVVRMCRFVPVTSGGFGGVACKTAAAYEYGPFGEALSVTGEDLGPSGRGGQGQRNPFRFSTKYTDAETGLVYYGYRYYSPGMGRWVSRDPVGEVGGKGLMGYVRNSPYSGVDALGLFLIAIDGSESSDWLTRDSESDRWNSHVRNFYEDYTGPGASMYLPGPTRWGTGVSAAVEEGYWRVCREIGIDPNSQINLIGYSRGGLIAILIAQELFDHPCNCQESTTVSFLGLYDAVDRYIWRSAPRIPQNVEFTAHARRDPLVLSRPSFGNAGTSGGKSYQQKYFWVTHSGAGGAPWAGDHPIRRDQFIVTTPHPEDGPHGGYWTWVPTITEQQDIDGSKEVDEWMREHARKRSVSLP